MLTTRSSFITLTLSLLLCISASIIPTVNSSAIVLKPTSPKPSAPEMGIVFVQGALLNGDQYIPLAKAIQNQFESQNPNLNVYISITNTWFEFPISFLATHAINQAYDELYKAGMSKSSTSYLIGHSLGGIAAVEYNKSHKTKKYIAGMILLGSIPERTEREKLKNESMMLIGGELDGLERISRFVEEFYHKNYNRDSGEIKFNFLGGNEKLESLTFLGEQSENNDSSYTAAILLEGLNHMSFCSGTPSSFVKSRDLKSEVETKYGHLKISQHIYAFISNDYNFILEALQKTKESVLPLIKAFEYEGSIYFNRPDQTKCHRGYCGKGTEWTKTAQEIISEKDKLKEIGTELNIDNDFVVLSSLPPFGDLFHPKMNKTGNTLNINTYSQCSWSFITKHSDVAYSPLSADEIGSKMYSRQCSRVYGGLSKKEDTPFDVDRNQSFCRDINKAAFDWALKNVSKKVAERFNKNGQKFNFIDDKYFENGFSFTYTKLSFEENKETGEIDVGSHFMATDIDAKPLPIFAPDGLACYHYCKLLSPARAMEWIHVDGLRKNYSMESQ